MTSLFTLPARFAVCAGALALVLSASLHGASAALPYSYEFSSKGEIKNVTLADGTVIIASIGEFVLQGKISKPEGGFNHTSEGGTYSPEYIVDSEDIKTTSGVTHKFSGHTERFALSGTYECTAASIKVAVEYKPRDIALDGGMIQMIFPVQFPKGMVTGEHVLHTDFVQFPTKAGNVIVAVDAINWAAYGAGGKLGFTPGRGGVNFYLANADVKRPEPLSLAFEVKLPVPAAAK